MGFWHTGYAEFHEQTGLEHSYVPEKRTYRCGHCGQRFDSIEELRPHRFQLHPYVRPLLLVRGVELGATPFTVARVTQPSDFVVERCAKGSFNGRPVELAVIPRLLSEVNYDTVTIELANDGPPAVFKLMFRIADEEHIKGVEASFLRFANRRVLTVRALEGFIQECRAFNTADTYYGGICDYLYGVLAKEDAPDSSLPHQEYQERFNRAADALRDYDRPLAHILRGLVAFHYNHFEDAAAFAPPGRLRVAGTQFVSILERGVWSTAPSPFKESGAALEDMLADRELLRICRWTEMPLMALVVEIDAVSALVKRDISEFDRLKLNVLLAEAYAAKGDVVPARKTARELIANPKTAAWAERLVARLGAEGQNS